MIEVNEAITTGLTGLGIIKGDIILLHSSLRSLGYIEGGAHTLINSILRIIGEEGTLAVPSLTGKREDSKENPPIFDVAKTPCWTGIIPETFRKTNGVIRSYHPTHSVAALGKDKHIITGGHEKSNSPCDKESPYYKIAANKGYILLIGVDQESNTSIHSCEEISNVPYHLQKDPFEMTIKGYDGESVKINNRLHQWNKAPTDFNRLDSIYYDKGIMKSSQICNAKVRLIRSEAMFELTIDILSKNPLFLVKDN